MRGLWILLFILCFTANSYAKAVVGEGQGCDSDINVAKKIALESAKRDALEKSGLFVSSKSIVLNGTLASDIIFSRAAATLHLSRKYFYDQKILENQTVCVRVRAYFDVDNKRLKKADFGLLMLINKKSFKAGDELKITISSEKRCVPYLFSVDAKKRIYKLLPNNVEKPFYLAGKFVYPSQKMKNYNYTVSIFPLQSVGLPQREEVLFVCLNRVNKALDEIFPSVFIEDSEELEDFLKRSPAESLMKLLDVLNQIGVENYDIANVTYEIVE